MEKKSYKKKEGPGDPVVKRQEATASETHLSTRRGGKERFCAADFAHTVIGFLTFCLSVAADVIRVRVGSVLCVHASSTGLPCLVLRMK